MLELTRDGEARLDPGLPAASPVDGTDHGAAGGPLVSLGEAVERTLVGRVVISVFVLLVGLTFVVTNLPVSQLKTDLGRVTDPFANVTGLDQNWTVFVSPRQTSAHVYARVDFVSGPSVDVPIPDERGLGAYVDYRWQKYEEQVRLDSGQWLWAAYAEHVADQVRDAGREPARVSLVRRWAVSNPPGPGPDRGPWREYTMYSTAVGRSS